MAPRGRGGKFSKPTRGGGKHFSRDVQPVDKDGNPLGMWRDPADEPSSEEEEDSSEEEFSEDDDDAPGPSRVAPEEMTREQRKAAAKAKKEAAIRKKNQQVAQPGDLPPTDSEDEDDDDNEDLPANPNHSAKSRSQARAALPADTAAAPERKPKTTEQLSRREREALEAQQARERYMKLHMEGKTDEARADMERLRLVRERREAEKARREAEKEEKEAQQKARQEEITEREMKLREAAMGKPRGGKKVSKK
ncbi:conserved hypothetical protein [Talaromyces stipitatus ATCC 10500]|uniref:Casein kinase substrate phosphoprotein PP28 domain-containing protein n=1 Tax=Talaromyces stipitatus (strain ATCC 10500 / CBS 375.48 / QM 6759 / NRRL 1006) TaxID=441959 RepID=B8MNJ6_TALSN|nr:uncharacterized protein TSTA_103120 [Talaromyces stipitatus ATCC 10500]EED14085.1 conserved hypothetical protein [Talaromyces stipitatus ATCC 10500]